MYRATWKRFYTANPNEDEGSGWLRGSQLVLMTSAGKLLEGKMKYGDRNSLAPALLEVLKAYAMLPKASRLPESVDGEIKPQLPPPSGGLVLTIYDRPLGRSDEGRYRHPEGDDFDGFRTHAPHGQRSSLWLTMEECKSLIPTELKNGQTLSVPEKLARRISLYGLVPQTLWVVEETWKPDSVKAVQLDVTIEDIREQTVRMRTSGHVVLSGPTVLHTWPKREFIKNLENRYDARLEGVLVYDLAKERIVRWDMTALGDYAGRWFAGNKGWKEATLDRPLSLAFAFELDQTAYELAPEHRRPRSFMRAYIFRAREEHYWDPDKWLTDWRKRQDNK